MQYKFKLWAKIPKEYRLNDLRQPGEDFEKADPTAQIMEHN